MWHGAERALRRASYLGSAGALLLGCARTPAGPFFHDEQYLRFGVDPHNEADSLVKLYAERSEPLALRLTGRDFTALGFMDREGRSTRARVVTLRGIALALDPEQPSPLTAAKRYALVANPLAGTHDADRDGFEEVFVEERWASESCLLVYRVRDVGYVDPVPVSLSLFGRERCPTGAADVDQDGKAELFVDVELTEFVLQTPPSVRVVLWPENHRFVLDTADHKLAHYVAAQQAARELELEQARSQSDVPEVLRLGVELAALTHLLGLPVRDQVARFERALQGVELSDRERRWAQAARAQIAEHWAEPATPAPADTPKGSAPAPRPSTLAEPGPS
jgi:hypothetical protein